VAAFVGVRPGGDHRPPKQPDECRHHLLLRRALHCSGGLMAADQWRQLARIAGGHRPPEQRYFQLSVALRNFPPAAASSARCGRPFGSVMFARIPP